MDFETRYKVGQMWVEAGREIIKIENRLYEIKLDGYEGKFHHEEETKLRLQLQYWQGMSDAYQKVREMGR